VKRSQAIEITLHAKAPAKPALAEACNGCGACCAAAPCPVSGLLLGHRDGACPALVWSDTDSRYRCGMVTKPGSFLRWLPGPFEPLAMRAFARWIAAGKGCDFDAELS
jgi:hypothetical protein